MVQGSQDLKKNHTNMKEKHLFRTFLVLWGILFETMTYVFYLQYFVVNSNTRIWIGKFNIK